ncbi:AAA family ATPase [Candidatus Woesearchaeota archaeon]|nr:AAA family ATPase [Candidatus Woesearchaeota archaeon]
MNKIIIIRGAAASGKTTISKSLAKQLRGKKCHIDVDVIRYFDVNAKNDNNEFPVANIAAAKLASVYLEHGYNIIIDSNIFQRNILTKLINNLPRGYPIFLFTLDSGLKKLIERDKKREKVLGQKLIKKIYNLVQNSDVHKGLAVDTTKMTKKAATKHILQYIKTNKGRII